MAGMMWNIHLPLILGALASASCDIRSEAMDDQAQQSVSELPEAYLDLLGTDSNLPLPRPRTGAAAIAVCGEAEDAEALFPGRGIYSVIRDTPFRLQSGTAGKETCDLTIVEKVPRARTSTLFSYPFCELEIDADGRIFIGRSSASSPQPELALAECFYRYGLFYAGYQGAFEAAHFNEAGESAYFAGRNWVGGRATWVAADLVAKCPNILKYYYTDDLRRHVIENCARELNREGY